MSLHYQNVILILLCLLLLTFCVSASADELVSFPEIPVMSLSPAGLYLGSNNQSRSLYSTTLSNVSPLYCFAYGHTSGTQWTVCFASESPGSFYAGFFNEDGSVYTSDQHSLGATPDSQSSLYYKTLIFTLSSCVLDNYPTLQDGLSALGEYVNNPPSSTLTSLQYSLPPGNAIYVNVSAGATFDLSVRMPESVLGANHYPGNNQVATLVNSLPSGGSAPSSPLIPWEQTGALSVLGLSRNASYSGTVASSGYLCIVNPLYYSGTANGPYEFMANGSIEISVNSQSGFYVYPLDSQLRFTSGLGIGVDTTIIDTPYDGQIDPDTGEIIWTDPEGGNQPPDLGGGNLEPVSNTIFDWLRNISQQFADFLKGPVNAVQVVVNSIREFMGSFVQLYSWLPTPVYQLITSALMIALTIGVIKIFV